MIDWRGNIVCYLCLFFLYITKVIFLALIFLGLKKITKNVCLKHSCQAGCAPGTQEDLTQGSFFIFRPRKEVKVMHIRNVMLSEKLAFAITEMVVNGRECRPSASDEQFSCIAFAYQPPSSSSTRRDLCNAQ